MAMATAEAKRERKLLESLRAESTAMQNRTTASPLPASLFVIFAAVVKNAQRGVPSTITTLTRYAADLPGEKHAYFYEEGSTDSTRAQLTIGMADLKRAGFSPQRRAMRRAAPCPTSPSSRLSRPAACRRLPPSPPQPAPRSTRCNTTRCRPCALCHPAAAAVAIAATAGAAAATAATTLAAAAVAATAARISARRCLAQCDLPERLVPTFSQGLSFGRVAAAYPQH